MQGAGATKLTLDRLFPPRKARSKTTAHQLATLQRVFTHTPIPSTTVRQELAEQLGMSVRSIQSKRACCVTVVSTLLYLKNGKKKLQSYPCQMHTHTHAVWFQNARAKKRMEGVCKQHFEEVLATGGIATAQHKIPHAPAPLGQAHHQINIISNIQGHVLDPPACLMDAQIARFALGNSDPAQVSPAMEAMALFIQDPEEMENVHDNVALQSRDG
jgi:hypothetical protein